MYRFAVTTPGGVIFNQNIFSFIHNNVLPVETDNLINGLILALRNGLTFYVRVEISSLVVLEEFDHGFATDVTL